MNHKKNIVYTIFIFTILFLNIAFSQDNIVPVELQFKTRHSNYINSIAFNLDGTQLASGSRDKTIKLWSVKEQKLINTLSGHSSPVNSVAFSPDGTLLASGSGDWTIKLWNVKKQKLIKTFSGHSSSVNSVIFNLDGTLFVSGSSDKTIKLWSVVEQKLIKTFSDHSNPVYSVAFSPDGTLFASGSADKTIKLWSVENQKLIKTFSGHSDSVYSVTFSSDGTLLASGSADNTINLWSVENQKLINTFSGHSGFINSVTFSPDSTLFASGSSDKTIKLWSVENQRLINTFSGHSDLIYSVVFSPDGTLLAVGSDGTYLYQLKRNGLYNPIKLFYTNNNASIAMNSNNKYLIHPGNTEDVYLKSNSSLKSLPVYTEKQIEVFTYNKQIILHETATPSLEQDIHSFLSEKQEVRFRPLLEGAILLGTNFEIMAGNPLFITIIAKNKGKDNLYQVKAIFHSTESLFDGLTFFLGKVEPGKQNSSISVLLIPDRWSARNISLTVEFMEANDYFCSPIIKSLSIIPRPQPILRYTWQINDDQTQSKWAVGNGDNKIQVNESFDLILSLLNEGNGQARKLKVTLDCPEKEGIDLFKAEDIIPLLKPGENKKCILNIGLKLIYPHDELPLNLSIIDEERFINILVALRFPLNKEIHVDDVIEIKEQVLVMVKAGSIIYAGPGTDMPEKVEVKENSVFKATGKSTGWFKVELKEKQSGWVEEKNCRFGIHDEIPVPQIQKIYIYPPPIIFIYSHVEENIISNTNRLTLSWTVTGAAGLTSVTAQLNGKAVNENQLIRYETGDSRVFNADAKLEGLKEGKKLR